MRDGLARWVAGRTIASVDVTHARAVRRHLAGAQDLAARLVGTRVEAASRRGKYLWLPLSSGEALVGHLGMSGQLLVQPPDAPDEKHLHVRLTFTDGGRELRFVDQRTFGGVLVDRLVPAPDRPEQSVPSEVVHIARDPMDPYFDEAAFVTRLRRRNSALKRALLDQTLVSGIGNIYADEALWRATLHGERICRALTRATVLGLLGHVRDVLGDAMRAGGDVVRRPVRQRERRERLLRPVAGRLRTRGRALPPVRHRHPALGVHEPVQLLVPARAAPSAAAVLTLSSRSCRPHNSHAHSRHHTAPQPTLVDRVLRR